MRHFFLAPTIRCVLELPIFLTTNCSVLLLYCPIISISLLILSVLCPSRLFRIFGVWDKLRSVFDKVILVGPVLRSSNQIMTTALNTGSMFDQDSELSPGNDAASSSHIRACTNCVRAKAKCSVNIDNRRKCER